jgi:O-acetyl-ADP-ribose deacetylase (regulator of RNase III)
MITQNKINYIRGDILETDSDVIAHGVNCKGVFGAGLAKEIRDKWPEVYNNYMDKFLRLGWRLGEIQINYPENKIVVNMATQENYGRDPKKVYIDYSAVAVCLDKLFKYCKEHSLSCAIPKIGCGLANGDWKTVGHIIAKTHKENRISLNIYSF